MADHLEQSSDILEDRNQELADTLAQLRTAQAELAESAKLSGLGEMLAGLAHELNNPMASVLGYAELLQAELRGASGDEAWDPLRFVDPLVTEGIRARDLICSLLQFSRTSDTTLESVDVAAALDVAIGLRGFAFARAGLALETDVEPDLIVIAEAQRLQQVFVNILNNALAAMEAGAGTTLRVSVRRFGDRVEVLFDDDGPGISDVAKIFEPFFTTKSVGEGTGLGLTLVHRFQEEFGGSVAAGTSPDGGARFVLTYRVGEPTRVESPEDAETLTPELIGPGNGKGGRLKVLLAEDEASIRDFQVQMLQRLDVEVVTVDTAAAAQAVLQREHVDVIVSDVRMPGEMNGADLFQWIRSERPEFTDRFMFVTGDVHDQLLVEWFEQYPDRFLIKPFRMKEYLERVGQMLNQVESQPADHSAT
jgi:two-component system NtrC family sensor kinase